MKGPHLDLEGKPACRFVEDRAHLAIVGFDVFQRCGREEMHLAFARHELLGFSAAKSGTANGQKEKEFWGHHSVVGGAIVGPPLQLSEVTFVQRRTILGHEQGV